MKLDEVKVRGVSGHWVVSGYHGEQVVLVVIGIQSLESCGDVSENQPLNATDSRHCTGDFVILLLLSISWLTRIAHFRFPIRSLLTEVVTET